jgi:hypothetical protein
MNLSYSFLVESYFAIIDLSVFSVFLHPAFIGSCPVRVYQVPHLQWSLLDGAYLNSADGVKTLLRRAAQNISAVLTCALRQGS